MQGVYWLLTIPAHEFIPYLPPRVRYIRGQLECGNGTGYLHWQLLVIFERSVRLSAVKSVFGVGVHCELSKSEAANSYVWKDETAVIGTRFELGSKPIKRNSAKDWDAIKSSAISGNLDDIPSDIYVRCYSSLKRIAVDHLRPDPIVKTVKVYWGITGSGKSHKAWDELGLDAYPKDPRTKFWDGYSGQVSVIIDEFRGSIDISHILRWTDRYPVIVEIKGSSVPLRATTIIFTSNLHPKDWYPDLDQETQNALLRRLDITHFDIPFQ